jgi:hypothetical protein
MNETERKKTLPVGKSFFDRVIEDGSYYVDKTLFIKDLLDKDAVVTLCTRPRRFGKTLNQTMLKCFFEDTTPLENAKDKRALFNGLKIDTAGERYLEHQGKYPVIFLSFKEAKRAKFEDSYFMLKNELVEEFKRHRYVSAKMPDSNDLALFERLASGNGDRNEYSTSVKFLSECLEKYHGRKAVILIDEYDVPLENSWARTPRFYDEMVDFIRPLLSSAFKDNPCLQFAVITGCLRVSKESIFTGLNNLKMDSVLSNAYSEYFGFTQNETDAMLDYYGFGGKKQIVRDWYNGYLFGNTVVYNPWSCLFAVDSWMTDINEYPKPYWVNTSGNDIIRDMISNMSIEAKAGLETLMTGGKISVTVDEYVTYGELYKNAGNLWAFLLFTGYLKKAGDGHVGENGELTVDLSIPNLELKYVFVTKVREWFEDYIKTKDREALFTAVLNGDAETVEHELSLLLMEYVSYMHSAERDYHCFVSGVLSGLTGYTVTSENESGEGRCDLVLHTRVSGKDSKAMIFEFKLAEERRDLGMVCEKAMKQIEAQKYAAKWVSYGYKHIIKYGVGFHKKYCKVIKGE